MIDQPKAARLAKQAFELWQAGRPEEAIPLYAEAIRLADPDHYGLPSYHGEFACALATVGKNPEALEQFQLQLAKESRQGDDTSVCVASARYFLAEHLLRMGQPGMAIETLAPSLDRGTGFEWLLRYQKALALLAQGHTGAAATEAQRALESCTTQEKRDKLSAMLAENGLGNGSQGSGSGPETHVPPPPKEEA